MLPPEEALEPSEFGYRGRTEAQRETMICLKSQLINNRAHFIIISNT